MSSSGLRHVPALDGLRAVAVLAVMFYHAGVAWMPGGFLGVDVFFVLSGFLITSLLLLEFEASSALDLPDFWKRRARRLLPALFVVLLVVLVYAAFLVGQSAATIRQDAMATLFYVSNWWFIVSGNSYFEQFSDPSPLTHTWSLAIEEQWYLLLPLMLVLLLPRVRSRRWWALGFLALALLSAAQMAWLSSSTPDLSREYYGTDTRLQALLVGAGLAAVLTPGIMERLRPLARVVSLGGFVGLALMFWIVDDSDRWMYRGGFLLVAALSALVVAAVVSHPQGPVARVMSLAPVVWIGSISYGLYLWHWPVYVFLSPQRTGTTGFTLLVLRFAVTFLAATISFYALEQPIRRGALTTLSTGQRLAVVIGAPLLVIGVAVGSALFARPPAPDSLEAVQEAATRTPTPDVGGDEQTRAILVGDSVALSLVSAYQPGQYPGLTVLPGTEFGCGVVPFQAALNGNPMPVREECRLWDQQRAGRIAAAQADTGVLFAGPWEMYDRWSNGREVPFDDPRWREATVADYERVLREMAQSTQQIVVVLDACHGAPDVDLPDAAVYQAGRYPGVVNDPARAEAVNSAMREAIRRSGLRVAVIDPNAFLCAGGFQPTIDGQTMYTDGVHFTSEGARVYWDWLGPRLIKAARSPQATPHRSGR